MINENKLGRSVVMNYTLMHKNIKVADLSLDEETGSIVKIGEIYVQQKRNRNHYRVMQRQGCRAMREHSCSL